MARILVGLLLFGFFAGNQGTTTPPNQRSQSPVAGKESTPFLLSSNIPPFSTPDPTVVAGDTVSTLPALQSVKTSSDTTAVAVTDSVDEGDEVVIAARLESARQHYLSALQAQSVGDSVLWLMNLNKQSAS